jgi:AbiV family abortive infection protein
MNKRLFTLDLLKSAREKTIENAWSLIKTAVSIFSDNNFPIACFLAMSAIEEMGKIYNILLTEIDANISMNKIRNNNKQNIKKDFYNHTEKAVKAASDALYINSGADNRHGKNKYSGIINTSGVVLLARSHRWMNIRNSCLYIDFNLSNPSISCPNSVITKEHAYYFICMAYEILAELAQSGLDSYTGYENENIGIQFWVDRLDDLSKFMEIWSNTVEIDNLDFLKNQEQIMNEIMEIEIKEKKSRDKNSNNN